EIYVRDLIGAVDTALEAWRPDLLLVSAGYDSLSGDPLGGFTLSPEDMATWATAFRERVAPAPVVAVLEGGYRLDLLAAGVSGTVLAARKQVEPHLPGDVFDLEAAEARFAQVLPKHAAARAALSAALHDLVGKRVGQPLWRLWGLNPSKAPCSSFTIGIDTPEKIRDKVLEAARYPILKIQLGTDQDEQVLGTVRDATDQPIRVDARAARSTAG